MLLNRKTAVVTGAANGIGRAIALKLADEGADMALLDIDSEGLAQVAGEIRQMGRRAIDIEVDFSERKNVPPAFRRIADELGEVDILVNNVGQSLRDKSGPWGSIEPALWDFMIDICLQPTLACTHEVVNGMRERKAGKIVNISSDSALIGPRENAPYAAAKGGVIGFTRALARELGPFQVTVNSIAPGYIRTRAMDRLKPELIEKALGETILGTMGEPEDIANAVLFLASDMGRYITGQTLVVNGGRWMV